jgi:hypothetical protein
MLERIGPSPAGGQCTQHEPMPVLPQVVDRDCLVRDSQRRIGIARLEFMLANLDHGIERKSFQPLPSRVHPLGPGFLWNRSIGKQAPLVEFERLTESIPAAVANQRLELRDIASDYPG